MTITNPRERQTCPSGVINVGIHHPHVPIFPLPRFRCLGGNPEFASSLARGLTAKRKFIVDLQPCQARTTSLRTATTTLPLTFSQRHICCIYKHPLPPIAFVQSGWNSFHFIMSTTQAQITTNGAAKRGAKQQIINGSAQQGSPVRHTDHSRWRLKNERGCQTWHYLESDEDAKKWPQTLADKYFLGLDLVGFVQSQESNIR